MRFFFIMNPYSRGGKSREFFNKLFYILDNQNVQYDYQIFSMPNEAYELSVTANKRGYDVIVAVGGDGTINRVLNGFFDIEGKRISSAKFGVVYTGTSPDFCKSYEIPTDFAAAVKVLLSGNSKEIQIGKIVVATAFDRDCEGKTIEQVKHMQPNNNCVATHYFGCCANVGIGAQVARGANSGIRKYFGDYLGTFMALIWALISYKPCKIIIFTDNKKTILDKTYNIFIGKTFYIASGIKVNHRLRHGDNRFYCMRVKNVSLSNVLNVLKLIYGGQPFNNSEVVTLEYGKVFEIAGNNQNPEIEFDGDPVGFLPCKIEMACDKLAVICEGQDV